jgi:Fur family ferric uptake transcriptional regulator
MDTVLAPSPPRGCAAVMMGVLRAHLRELGLPLTHQREAIAQILFESSRHLSADDIGEMLRERGEQIGKATVYRTVKLLVDVDLAVEHDFDEGFKRYEMRAGPAHYDHLICTSCGKVADFSRPEIENIQLDAAAEHGFQVVTRQFKIYGLCGDCADPFSEAYEPIA